MGYCPCFGLLKGSRRKTEHGKKDSHYGKLGAASKMAATEMAPKQGSNAPNKSRTFTFQELAIATNNFSEESFLGRGGFGAVFKGNLPNGQVVAVKQLDQSGLQGDKEFLVEVLVLSLLDDPNLVKLIGYCAQGSQRLLVYEYMPLGSLEDHLFEMTAEMEPLDWNTRMKIAAGAARGLDSLHRANPPVIYRDLKASNILLDEGFKPKLSDFGLAKFGPSGDNTHVSTRVMGTYGYCAPEYASTGKLTTRTDIYSYGIVLLELITGRRAVDEVNGCLKHLATWALPLMKERSNFTKMADPLLRGQYSQSSLAKALQIASMCLNEDASLRPKSGELVQALEYLESKKYESKEAKNKELPPKWPEIVFSPSETNSILETDLDRDQAVTDAKLWSENWRDKKQQCPKNTSDQGNNRWVNKVQQGHGQSQ